MLFWAATTVSETTAVGIAGDVWILDARTGTTSKVFPESRYFWPVWSPDGEWVIAPRSEDSLNATALFRRRADGRGPPERLTAAIPDRYMQPYDVSRDGRQLFYQVTTTTGEAGSDIYVLSLVGEHTSRALLATAAQEYGPALSPDGRWLAYAVAEKGHVPQVYVTDFPALARRRQVSFEGGDSPVWSPDGRSLFFALAAGAEQGVDRVSFSAAQDPPTGRPERFARSPAMSANVGTPYGRSYDVSPDGRRLLTSGSSIGGGRLDTAAVRQLSVILNWTAVVRRALKR
jgi:dipeptidyl aminopeptidase/acylaminoacyl peptidase